MKRKRVYVSIYQSPEFLPTAIVCRIDDQQWSIIGLPARDQLYLTNHVPLQELPLMH